MNQNRERLNGTISAVFGPHVFIHQDTTSTTYFAKREQLDFTDPYIGLPVTFTTPGRPLKNGLTCANDVSKAVQ
jgi:hypothetical protein